MLLPLSGIDWSELCRGCSQAFMHGVTIGGVRLAPADMIAASLLFSLAVIVTRYVQRVLDVKVLQRLQIDLGVQNSIRTGVGYFGFIMAMLLAIGALGLNLSNLALVAGALSVGIGFGFAERRQQLRRRADPAGGAANQGRGLGHRRRQGGGRETHQRPRHRTPDFPARFGDHSKLRAGFQACDELDLQGQVRPGRYQDRR